MNERMAVALAVIVIIVAVVGFILYEAPNVASNSKNFGYSYSVIPSQTHSIQVTNTNGPINVINWNNSQIVINGTVTSNGFGASPSDARLSQSDTNGAIVFSANQSSSFFFFGGYTVSINVYVPSGLNFAFLKVTTVNGEVKTSQLNSASVDASSVNGELSVACNCLETHLSS